MIYSDGLSEDFKAIQIVEKGIFIGRLLKEKDSDTTEFILYGFIPKTSVQSITNGKKRKILFRNKGFEK